MKKVNKITALIILVLIGAVVVLSINLINCHIANKQLRKVVSMQANQLDEMDSIFYNYNVLVK